MDKDLPDGCLWEPSIVCIPAQSTELSASETSVPYGDAIPNCSAYLILNASFNYPFLQHLYYLGNYYHITIKPHNCHSQAM